MTISEALWLQQKKFTGATVDCTQTPYNEVTMAGPQNFLLMELRSTSAVNNEDVNGNGVLDTGEDLNGNGSVDTGIVLANTVSTTANTGLWRIVRDDNGNGNLDAATENAVTLLNGVGKIPPGGLFNIASADSNPVGSAAFYVDYSGAAGDFELVAPNKTAPPYTGTPPTTPVPRPCRIARTR